MGKLDRCSLLAGDECTSLAELREQNAELQVDLRNAVELLKNKAIVYLQECGGPKRLSMDSEVHRFLNRPSVKAVMEGE